MVAEISRLIPQRDKESKASREERIRKEKEAELRKLYVRAHIREGSWKEVKKKYQYDRKGIVREIIRRLDVDYITCRFNNFDFSKKVKNGMTKEEEETLKQDMAYFGEYKGPI